MEESLDVREVKGTRNPKHLGGVLALVIFLIFIFPEHMIWQSFFGWT